MAKAAKDRPAAAAKSGNAKTGGVKSPGSRPTHAGKPAKASPDTPQVRSPERETSGNSGPHLSPEDVYKLIAERAYFKAKARGFAPGHEVQDWIEAEQEVRRRLEGRA
jgi:Protein of unknown function (DUF2934)